MTATLVPVTRALFDVVLAKWAAPGMNNPDDDQSFSGDDADVDPALLRDAADRDRRSQSQRNGRALARMRGQRLSSPTTADHLAVFSDLTNEPLFFGRSRRLASQAQRLMAFAQNQGCSKDDCPTPFAHTEMHHAEQDWADGGLTDATDMAPACGPHNRAAPACPAHRRRVATATHR